MHKIFFVKTGYFEWYLQYQTICYKTPIINLPHNLCLKDVSKLPVFLCRRGRDRMVFGFLTTYAISAYYH